MPYRPLTREQVWLMPPSLDEVIPLDHPARFVAAFVEELDREDWAELGIDIDGEALGAPAYHPEQLLSVWIYGFMTKVRSSRKLESACREQLPYLWLSGWQKPDHNTLWRFYQRNREGLRKLFKRTVRTAVRMGLVDLAVQAVDGTKVAANVAKARTYDEKGLARLLERTEAAIKDLEAQNRTGGEEIPACLPKELSQAKALREKVQQALEGVRTEEGKGQINLTDVDAKLMKTGSGFIAGYNAQTVVSPLKVSEGAVGGFLITATEVVTDQSDNAQLTPMLEQASENTGQSADLTLADAGYHSTENLAACAEREQAIVMPESQQRALTNPYHKDAFSYEPETDSYRCPEGQRLRFSGVKRRRRRGGSARIYRGSGAVCRECPAFGICTKNRQQGRSLQIGQHDDLLRQHRSWMDSADAKEAYRKRKQLSEPVFGILKEQLGIRRFLLRGLEKVRAEWDLLATAFNLRTLLKVWQLSSPSERWKPALAIAG